MARAAQNTVLKAAGADLSKILRGQQLSVFFEGTDAYSAVRTGTVTVDDGTVTIECEAKMKVVGSLFNLVRDYGRESIYTQNQPFDASMIFDKLEDAGMSIDPRTLYTAVMVFVPQHAPTTGL